MFLKSIKLHNIRSYENQEINFPAGSVLLAGDIGSGKSTILLAIEFAIFGAKKAELPAYTLLRHGKKEGSVELKMQVENKEIIIKRTLKRSNDDIKQEAGYLIIDGLKKDATTEELRAIVLDLLGYPKDLVKKGKDLIYRYTVYTPQEEMKKILYESKEARLDTLRKVFNIDKYKRVKENSTIILKSAREKKRYFDGFIIDLEYKKKELEERKLEIKEIDKSIDSLLPKIEDVKNSLKDKKAAMEQYEAQVKELNFLKKELSVAETSILHKIEQNNLLNQEIRRLESQLESLKKELEGKSLEEPESINAKITEKDKEISEIDRQLNSLGRRIRETEVKIESSRNTIEKINSLEICPVCQQNVDHQHKHDIGSREMKIQEELVEKIKELSDEEPKLEKLKAQLRKEIELLNRELGNLQLLKVKFQNLNEKTSQREEKLNSKENLKKEIGFLNSKKSELSVKIEGYSGLEEKYNHARKEMDKLLAEEKFLEGEKRELETKKSLINRFISVLEKEIDEKQKAKDKLVYLSQLINWIDELFINLMSSMEKHVMASIHLQFNELFKKWFDVLIGDESISVGVDEEFTPVIEQNGYETYIENLSGGERTSVALSYRLALNKIINDIVAEIKTKDIIMLDEPTDGFSSEQLDKVRDVLDQLNINQIIIVSHESKIESFVQNVIRIDKRDNVSIVV